jgi:hypothetical protein
VFINWLNPCVKGCDLEPARVERQAIITLNCQKCLTVKKTLAYLELRPNSFSTLGSGNLLFLRQINPINPTKKTFFPFWVTLALNGDKDKLFEKISSMLTKQPEKRRRKR